MLSLDISSQRKSIQLKRDVDFIFQTTNPAMLSLDISSQRRSILTRYWQQTTS
jgi:hypothetical protein